MYLRIICLEVKYLLLQADLYIGHHGEKMLESFCKWQHEEFGKKNDIHLEMSTSWGEDMASVDAAILITRYVFQSQLNDMFNLRVVQLILLIPSLNAFYSRFCVPATFWHSGISHFPQFVKTAL